MRSSLYNIRYSPGSWLYKSASSSRSNRERITHLLHNSQLDQVGLVEVDSLIFTLKEKQMLKRINYISSFAQDMSNDEIEELARQAAKKNAENDITGVLMAKGGVFFQIIEGPEENIDRLFTTILKDPRHEKVITLGIQIGDIQRLFLGWNMKAINLDTTLSERLQPVRAIIDAVHAQSAIIETLTEALAASAWAELLDLTTKE